MTKELVAQVSSQLVVGKVFCKILNNRLVECLEGQGALHEVQADFRRNRSCIDNVYIKMSLYKIG